MEVQGGSKVCSFTQWQIRVLNFFLKDILENMPICANNTVKNISFCQGEILNGMT